MDNQFSEFCRVTYRMSKDGTIRDGRNKAVTAVDAHKEFSLHCYNSGIPWDTSFTPTRVAELMTGWQQEAIAAKEKEKQLKKDKEKGPPPQEILDSYFSCEGKHWKISKTWSEIEYLAEDNGSCPRASDIEMLSKVITVWALNRGLPCSQNIMKMALLTKQSEEAARVVDRLFKDMRFNPAAIGECDRCLDAIHDLLQITETKEVFRCVMKHWVWQVKRKIRGYEVIWEIWPNFYGAPGTGKSTLIREMCAVLSEFYAEPPISVLGDVTRERDKFTTLYVLNFDELTVGGPSRFLGDEKAVPADLQRGIKQVITQKKLLSRTLGGQEQANRRMTFSAISSANEHLYDIVFDETGMRRFFEFHCTKDKETLNSEYYRVKDELQAKLSVVWKGVDESQSKGYFNQDCAEWQEIRAIQGAYYPTKTTTSEWVEDQRVIAGGESNAMDMYKDYSDWCRARGYKARGNRSWLEDLHHIIPGSREWRRNLNISYAEDAD